SVAKWVHSTGFPKSEETTSLLPMDAILDNAVTLRVQSVLWDRPTRERVDFKGRKS
ncbi:hypothetical protein M404DRAFT_1003338, partial [Pisolithus tinctorius Marx 270]